jgi:hypothetical protein
VIIQNIHSFTALESHSANLNITDIELTQYNRRYTDGYNFNFVKGFEGINDFHNINYSNLYLTKKQLLDSIAKYTGILNDDKARIINSPIKIGNEYIKFEDIDVEPYKQNNRVYEARYYNSIAFTSDRAEAELFHIIIDDNELCYVTYTRNNKYFALTYSADQEKFIFVDTTKFVLQNNINTPFKLKIQYEKFSPYIFLSLLSDQRYLIHRSGDDLTVSPFGDKTKSEILASKFTLERDSIEQQVNILNTSVASYTDDNVSINSRKIDTEIETNYLLVKNGDLRFNNFELLQLKNIVNTNETITSNNSLVSSVDYTTDIYSMNNREYTSICSPVDQETGNDITLSYVFSNQDIYIHRDQTEFITSPSLAPFASININDTKFVDCGSFSSIVPQYADRVYKFSNSTPIENQQYLCTWLSGMPVGDEKVWVDRYYYPDQISRQAALEASGTPVLVNRHTNLDTLLESPESAINIPFFDKKSDLTFEPNTKYRYDRIGKYENILKGIDFCEKYYDEDIPIDGAKSRLYNYYREINESGHLILAFKFIGEGQDFTIRSQRANIDGGINISKTSNSISFEFKLFEPSTQRTRIFTYTHNNIDIVTNDFVFGFDNNTGEGNVYLNTIPVFKFSVPAWSMTDNYMLFGDIDVGEFDFVLYNKFDSVITDTFLYTQPFRLVDLLQLVHHRSNIDIEPITISIPCGMRNNVDSILSLNGICFNQSYKSNYVNIDIKNLSVDNSLMDGVKENVLSNAKKWLPANTKINNITFNKYK